MHASRIWCNLFLASVTLPLITTVFAADRPTANSRVTFHLGDESSSPSDADNSAASSNPVAGACPCDCDCAIDNFRRAGQPQCVRRWATPSNTGRYCGYYVGGGLPLRGEGRDVQQDGTWGWDYCGLLALPKLIQLNWSHGQRSQGGTGAYKTDGPKLRHE